MKFEDLYEELVEQLRAERNKDGFWSGHLASSALSTAVAIVALKINKRSTDQDIIAAGLHWLIVNQNTDGGYGDTPESVSNISTTLLCYASLFYCGGGNAASDIALLNINRYLARHNIDLTKGNITESVLSFYGKDFTFSVPILSMLVICGVLDQHACSKIPQLPFEFTLLPARWYNFFNLRMVSYALPALIGVGIFIFRTNKLKNPLLRWIRNRSIHPAVRKLERIVPESGGFLEAIPLTAFVSMCLQASGIGNTDVITKGLGFLRTQQRADGSWPIDTDLSTWVTTLSIKALGQQMPVFFPDDEREKLKIHLKTVQYKEVHPFNLALPGGWGWTNNPGSVPDVDDTSGAILSLLELYDANRNEAGTITNGCRWLIGIQNSDGGFPTFCKGWGRLPFDSSCADLTGHAMLALAKSFAVVGHQMSPALKKAIRKSLSDASDYLQSHQNNGCWFPLWFGNQHAVQQKNPVYGTAKVSVYLLDLLSLGLPDQDLNWNIEKMLAKARAYLLAQQNTDGSWGAAAGVRGSTEETALAVAALVHYDMAACYKGLEWIESEYRNNGMHSEPIGLYFALLWYDEKLYPLIYTIEALRRLLFR